jgi:hypothetical protein
MHRNMRLPHRLHLRVCYLSLGVLLGLGDPAIAQERRPEAQAQTARSVSPSQAQSKSPPQPQQKQGLEYFLGTWSFKWTGRESPITVGRRNGVATFVRIENSNFMEFRLEGRSEDGTAFKDTTIVGWNAEQKTMAFRERLANGIEVLSIGEWAIPLAIHLDIQPVRIGQSVFRLRRTYNIGAVHAFDVVDDLATDDGPYQRLGKSEFTRTDLRP